MAGTFPPKKASKRPKGKSPSDDSTTTTGKGGLAASLRLQRAGTKDAPGVEKTVNNP